MSIEITERKSSRTVERDNGKYESAVFEYNIKGTSSETDAITQLENQIESSYQGLTSRKVSLSPVTVDILKPLNCLWLATVTYDKPNLNTDTTDGDGGDEGGNPPVLYPTPPLRSFDTAGEVHHRTHAISTMSTTMRAGLDQVDYNDAINMTEEGIEGVDVVGRDFHYSVTKTFYGKSFNNYDMEMFSELTGTVNADLYNSYWPGNVLFLGATGQEVFDNSTGVIDTIMTYRFQVKPRELNLTIAGIEGISKEGFEYVWVKTNPVIEGDTIIQKADAVIVSRVYNSSNFNRLGV